VTNQNVGVTTAPATHERSADQERKAPGRPRSARADEAIVEALLDLLAEGTPAEAISIEAVAAKAGVGKATIYRRWPNKEALLVDAIASLKGDPPQIAGESVRDDLVTLLRPVGTRSHTRAGKIMPCIMSELHRSPELSRCVQKITEPRRELMRQVLRRGIESGQLRADLDIELVMVALSGPLLAQAALAWSAARHQRNLPERLVDLLWPALLA
jgi:AcrR family transcriptional regulator